MKCRCVCFSTSHILILEIFITYYIVDYNKENFLLDENYTLFQGVEDDFVTLQYTTDCYNDIKSTKTELKTLDNCGHFELILPETK